MVAFNSLVAAEAAAALLHPTAFRLVFSSRGQCVMPLCGTSSFALKTGIFLRCPAFWLLLPSPFAVKDLMHSGREAGSKIFAIRPGCNVIVTSTCEAKTYRRALHELLPLPRMRVLHVLQ
jgi:hypothetical protein